MIQDKLITPIQEQFKQLVGKTVWTVRSTMQYTPCTICTNGRYRISSKDERVNNRLVDCPVCGGGTRGVSAGFKWKAYPVTLDSVIIRIDISPGNDYSSVSFAAGGRNYDEIYLTQYEAEYVALEKQTEADDTDRFYEVSNYLDSLGVLDDYLT